MNRRSLFTSAAAVLIILGLLLPTGWYDTIPREPGVVLPFSGAILLRLTFLVEAIVLLYMAARNVTFVPFPAAYGPLASQRREFPSDLPRRQAMVILTAITALAVYLRVKGIMQDMWIDEVTPLIDYMHLTTPQIVGSYLQSNNHALNTLLERFTIGVFGEFEWSVRLPAVVFGVLTVPGLYWVARTALSRAASLGAALVLAASYHHVFFSQNARGYSAYLLFALLATGLLVRALRSDRLSVWALYAGALVLGCLSLLITAFVIASHAAILIVVGLRLRGRAPVAPYARRVAAVLGTAGLLSFQFYAAALPEAYVVLTTEYVRPSTGYAPFSSEFLAEMARGIIVGFGSASAAAVFLLLGAAGFVALTALSWQLAAGLVLPGVLTAALLGVRGLTFSPRFFLLWLPLAILAALSAVQIVALGMRRLSPRVTALGIAVVSVVLAFSAGKSLPYYYRTPKQPYTAALRLVEERGGSGNVLIVANATRGFRYYSMRMPVSDISRYHYPQSLATFDSLATADPAAESYAMTTFSRATRMELPELIARLERDWQADTTFAATIGNGEITVWSRKRPSLPE